MARSRDKTQEKLTEILRPPPLSRVQRECTAQRFAIATISLDDFHENEMSMGHFNRKKPVVQL